MKYRFKHTWKRSTNWRAVLDASGRNPTASAEIAWVRSQDSRAPQDVNPRMLKMKAIANDVHAPAHVQRATVFVCTSSSPFPDVAIAIALASSSRKLSRRCESGSVRWSTRAPTSPRQRGAVDCTSLPCANSSFLSCPPISPLRPLRGLSSSCSSQSLLSSVELMRATYSRESRLWWMKSGAYDCRFASLSHESTSEPIGRPCSKYVGSCHTRLIACNTVLRTRVAHSVATRSTSPHSEACTPWFRSTCSSTCLTESASTASTLPSPSPRCRRICPARAFVALLGSSDRR
mmetsp:Transcript_9775/g.23938  ORF Transcript_9775/g.23938 Transcript_9775/m.23938 type:complete len:290 (-) Transcript_9775:950-1819(-)